MVQTIIYLFHVLTNSRSIRVIRGAGLKVNFRSRETRKYKCQLFFPASIGTGLVS